MMTKENRIDLITITVALILLGMACCAQAGVFVDLGRSNFQKPTNGIWWQDQYPHDFDLRSSYKRIGYEYNTYRISLFSLGNYKTEALATGDEVGYFAGTCDISTCAPADRYTTTGSVEGVLLSKVFRSKPFFIEGGISYTRQSFTLKTNILENGSINGPLGHSYMFQDTQSGVGYMLSTGLDLDDITIAVSLWKADSSAEFFGVSGFPGIDLVKTVSIGYRF